MNYYSKDYELTFSADIRQFDGEKWWLYDHWEDVNVIDVIATDPENEVTRIISSQNNHFMAVFAEEINIELKNSFTGISYGGIMLVDSVSENLPKTFNIKKLYSITAEAVNEQSVDNINYNFDHWEDQNTSRTRVFTASSDITHTAYFTGIPSPVQNVHDVGYIGQPIHLVWDQHSNSACQYRIYRRVKNQNEEDFPPPVLIATLSNNITEYIDDTFCKTRGYTDYLLMYDVRSYYTIEQTEAEAYWYSIFGNYFLKTSPSLSDTLYSDNPLAFEVSNFPNPFNPVTTIKLILPKSSYVKVNVYNYMGQNIKNICSKHLEEGTHYFKWNGLNNLDHVTASGIYFLKIKYDNQVMHHKIILSR